MRTVDGTYRDKPTTAKVSLLRLWSESIPDGIFLGAGEQFCNLLTLFSDIFRTCLEAWSRGYDRGSTSPVRGRSRDAREQGGAVDNDLHALELPAFELDCRDWLIATPADGSIPEEIAGAPVVAVLSTAVIGADDIMAASAVLSIGLLDEPVDSIKLAADSPVAELIDLDASRGQARYVVPAPEGPLALLAEFSANGDSCDLMDRFVQLMASFRWAS